MALHFFKRIFSRHSEMNGKPALANHAEKPLSRASFSMDSLRENPLAVVKEALADQSNFFRFAADVKMQPCEALSMLSKLITDLEGNQRLGPEDRRMLRHSITVAGSLVMKVNVASKGKR